MELIMEIKVYLKDQYAVCGKDEKIVMIDFTGTASGKYFNGKVIGSGVDTQRIQKDNTVHLSARYMLEGTDYKDNKCRIFIENNGSDLEHCVPNFVTDSEALSEFEKSKLHAVVKPLDEYILISIYKINSDEFVE